MVAWLERTESDIQRSEPIDLTAATKELRAQLTKFQVFYTFMIEKLNE